MLIEEIELTLSHVDLGVLDEAALMCLFGSAHAHRITQGTGHSIRDIRDAAGNALYGGYYWTHLRVPPARLLREHRVWDRVSVGVDVQSFGAMLLASTYALGRPGELDATDAARWPLDRVPSMRAANAFYQDGAESSMAAPAPGMLASLPRLGAAPPALARFRSVATGASIDPGLAPTLTHAEPIAHRVQMGRELRPGHGIMFARFVAIADAVERRFLTRAIAVPLPRPLADGLATVERETFYFANVRREQRLAGRVRARVERCPADDHGPDKEVLAMARIHSIIELSDEDNVPLVAARVTKLLVVPRAAVNRVMQAERWVAAHAG